MRDIWILSTTIDHQLPEYIISLSKKYDVDIFCQQTYCQITQLLQGRSKDIVKAGCYILVALTE